MAVWTFDYLTGGLAARAPSLGVCLLRVALAVALAWKFAWEARHGAWHWFDCDSFVRHEQRGLRLSRTGYQILYVVRALAVAALLAGVYPRAAAVVLVVALAWQLTFENTHTTLFLAVAAALVACSDGAADCLTWRTVAGLATDGFATDGFASTVARETAARCDGFAAVLGVLVVCGMYVNTAVQKLRSPDYLSGMVLYRWLEHMVAVRPARPAPYPRPVVRWFVAVGPETGARRLRLPSRAVIGLEMALPVGLLWPPAWPFAALAGLATHAAFAVLSPVRLVPFSLAVVGTYPLFVT